MGRVVVRAAPEAHAAVPDVAEERVTFFTRPRPGDVPGRADAELLALDPDVRLEPRIPLADADPVRDFAPHQLLEMVVVAAVDRQRHLRPLDLVAAGPRVAD